MFRLLVIFLSITMLVSCEDSDSLFGPPSDVKDNIFDHINHYRLLNGISVLEENSELNQLAIEHAQYMSQNNVINHDGQSTRYTYAVEELSMSRYAELVEGGDLYGRDLIEKWSGNDDALSILLGDFTYIGLGVYGDDDQKYAAIIFTK